MATRVPRGRGAATLQGRKTLRQRSTSRAPALLRLRAGAIERRGRLRPDVDGTRVRMAELRDAVPVGYVRTPFGRADPQRGVFRDVRSDDLARVVLRKCLRRTGLAPGDTYGVILGAVEMMGEQAHRGTAIPFLAGFPPLGVGLGVEPACTTAMMPVHIATMEEVSIGHPVGASGARLIGTTALELGRRGGRFGLAAVCGGMGQGVATILEAI